MPRSGLHGPLVALTIGSVAWACSYVEIETPEDGYAIGRTMELPDILDITDYKISVYPRGAKGHGSLGFVAIDFTILDYDIRLTAEGMNEKNFTVSALMFNQGEFQSPSNGTESIHSIHLVEYLLSRCDSVESALQLLDRVTVQCCRLLEFGSLGKLHWALHDASGRSVVVEYLEGQKVVYENTPRVLTNDPDLKWHWRNLNTYVNVNPTFPTWNRFLEVDAGGSVGKIPRTVGHGFNLAGLPGDTSPPSRFVQIFYLRGYAMHGVPPSNVSDAIVLATGLLNKVWIIQGTVASEPNYERTDWGVVKAPKLGRLLIRGYRNTQWREVDLNRLDFSEARSWPLETGDLGVADLLAPPGPPAGAGALAASVI